MLTSRAEGVESRIGSYPLAVLMADAKHNTVSLRNCRIGAQPIGHALNVFFLRQVGSHRLDAASRSLESLGNFGELLGAAGDEDEIITALSTAIGMG
jgi:hypothetical protein